MKSNRTDVSRLKFIGCFLAGALLAGTVAHGQPGTVPGQSGAAAGQVGVLSCQMGVAAGQAMSSGRDPGDDRGAGRLLNFSSRLFNRIQGKAADMDKALTQQTKKYLARIQHREDRLHRKLENQLEHLYSCRRRGDRFSSKDSLARLSDSIALARLFDGSIQQRYSSLTSKMQTQTGNGMNGLTGEYKPYIDSLTGSLKFLNQHPELLGGLGGGLQGANLSVVTSNVSALTSNMPPQLQQLQGSLTQLNQLQAKLQDADQVKQFIRERKEQISRYLSSHEGLAGSLGRQFQGMNQDLYYYSQQVREYKEMLNDPDALTRKALSLLNQLPAFQSFMKQNGQLAGLFGLPGNYGSPQALAGLQTRDQVSQLIQSQVAAGGSGGAAALQANLQSAQSQLDSYKDKLNKLGSGSGAIDMPNFKPNDQKTKRFWKRLEYGANFQTSRNNQYYPTVADLGLSVGYKLGHSNTIGLGTSFKLGLGNGWNHIALSSQGVGLRSFIDVKLKGSFFVSGGFEYNYTRTFGSFRQLPQLHDWTKSGLIGVSKTVSVKSRVFKKTKISLLWDFLSYSQIPKTQPVLFRVGYQF